MILFICLNFFNYFYSPYTEKSTIKINDNKKTDTNVIINIVITVYHTNADTTKNKKLKNLSDIFTVKITEMLPYWDAVHVDLARLSQPLLPHLVSLLKELLQWFKRKTNSITLQNKNNGHKYDTKRNENGNKIRI